MSNIIELLGLNCDETQLLFSYQYQLVLSDIESEKAESKLLPKNKWLNNWKSSVEKGICSQQSNKYKLITDSNELEKRTKELIDKSEVHTSFNLILLELVCFTPYQPLSLKKIEDKEFKNLKFYSKENTTSTLHSIADELQIDQSTVQLYRSSLKSSTRGITGFWQKIGIGAIVGTVVSVVTAGMAAPYIAALLAPAGLTGAAATSAGLALLGGGAVATGGMGISGGIAVIVGGGALLGATTGTGAGAIFSHSPEFALSQAVKLEVVMKEIILNNQLDVRLSQELIKKQRDTIRVLEEDLFQLKINDKENKEKIKNLSKTLKYLKKSVDRNQEHIIDSKN